MHDSKITGSGFYSSWLYPALLRVRQDSIIHGRDVQDPDRQVFLGDLDLPPGRWDPFSNRADYAHRKEEGEIKKMIRDQELSTINKRSRFVSSGQYKNKTKDYGRSRPHKTDFFY